MTRQHSSVIKSKQPVACTTCGSKKVVRRGYRKKKLEILPLYLCKSCGRTFTKQIVRGKTYPRVDGDGSA